MIYSIRNRDKIRLIDLCYFVALKLIPSVPNVAAMAARGVSLKNPFPVFCAPQSGIVHDTIGLSKIGHRMTINYRSCRWFNILIEAKHICRVILVLQVNQSLPYRICVCVFDPIFSFITQEIHIYPLGKGFGSLVKITRPGDR